MKVLLASGEKTLAKMRKAFAKSIQVAKFFRLLLLYAVGGVGGCVC